MGEESEMEVFTRLGLPRRPLMLAPLNGVSDHPFRRVCARAGADLTYVEMLSATALLYGSKRTFDMLARHAEERRVGVQLTGKTADEVGRAVEILDRHPFETIDINMGCPVTKVTKNGAGSAILKDPERVRATVTRAKAATDKPLSVKIRIGWDARTVTALEVAQAAQEAGAAWLTMHGRLRSDDYSVPVDLDMMARVRDVLQIPFIGNGNLFCKDDVDHMERIIRCDGAMVSRGTLGNPWIFREIKTGDSRVTLDEWRQMVVDHLDWQAEAYGDSGFGALCMRKHLLWYLKGWPGGKKVRDQVVKAESMGEARVIVESFAEAMARSGVTERSPFHMEGAEARFRWDPKYEMDRRLDRGVGDDLMSDSAP